MRGSCRRLEKGRRLVVEPPATGHRGAARQAPASRSSASIAARLARPRIWARANQPRLRASAGRIDPAMSSPSAAAKRRRDRAIAAAPCSRAAGRFRKSPRQPQASPPSRVGLTARFCSAQPDRAELRDNRRRRKAPLPGSKRVSSRGFDPFRRESDRPFARSMRSAARSAPAQPDRSTSATARKVSRASATSPARPRQPGH